MASPRQPSQRLNSAWRSKSCSFLASRPLQRFLSWELLRFPCEAGVSESSRGGHRQLVGTGGWRLFSWHCQAKADWKRSLWHCCLCAPRGAHLRSHPGGESQGCCALLPPLLAHICRGHLQLELSLGLGRSPALLPTVRWEGQRVMGQGRSSPSPLALSLPCSPRTIPALQYSSSLLPSCIHHSLQPPACIPQTPHPLALPSPSSQLSCAALRVGARHGARLRAPWGPG